MRKIAVLAFAATSVASFGQVYSGGGAAIPDGTNTGSIPGSVSSTINAVPGLTSVSAIAIRGLRHTWAGDLSATVTGPSGSFMLFGRVGRAAAASYGTPFGDSSNFGSNDPTPLTGRDYIFLNSGGANLWTVAGGIDGVTGIAGGSYDASGINGGGAASGLFPGAQAGGDWTLTITDNAGGDTGAFDSWEIRATAVPEPATMAILGLGAAALIRRRRK